MHPVYGDCHLPIPQNTILFFIQFLIQEMISSFSSCFLLAFRFIHL